MRLNSSGRCTVWILSGMILLGTIVLGQEPPAGTPDDSAAPVDAAAAPAGEEADDGRPPALREQTIYIPYRKLREVFEQQGRGVFLPYEQFQELWNLARQRQPDTPEERPPVGALITEIENEATVEQDVIQVEARLHIELLGKGWHEVPLRLKDAALASATVGEQPARVIVDESGGYRLLIRNEQDAPRELTVNLRYAKAYAKSPAQNSVSFEAPQAPVNRGRIRIPQPGVKVQIHPLIAATEAPGEPEEEDAPPVDETVVLAFVGAAPVIRIDWTPKAEGASGLEALATVQTEQQIAIAAGVVRVRTRLAYAITRAAVAELVVQVPADYKVTGVFDPNVRQWKVDRQDDQQTITVQLFEPTLGTQQISIELEQFVEQAERQQLQLPVVRAVGVGRQQGVVVVNVDPELRAETVRRVGLLQLDASELPNTLQNTKWSFAYRFSTLPFELVIEVEPIQPEIAADHLVEVMLEPDQLELKMLSVLDIRRAGVFQIDFDIPEGFEVRQVRGGAAPNAEAVSVDAYHRTDQRLRVNFAKKAQNRVALLIHLVRGLDDPNLAAPTGNASQIPVPLPTIATPVESVRGRLVLYAPESLRVNPRETSGLRTISYAEAYEGLPSARQGAAAARSPTMAFAFRQDPVVLSWDVERRRPHITVRQLFIGRIESGVVKYSATFFFRVRYSGVPSLRIDVPAALADEIRNVGAGIRQSRLDPPPDDVPDGYVAWSFGGETELLGDAQVRLEWEEKSEELEIGKSMELEIPVLKPAAVDRAWGQVLIGKAETLDVQAKQDAEGLRPIDPQHDLMEGASAEDVARAFEFHDAWKLAVVVTRYELEPVKRTSIERALVRMVVTRSDRVAVQALYRMRSAVQRLAVRFPQGVEFDRDPLRINGQPRGLEQGEGDTLFIPLVGQEPDQSFLLELRYSVPDTTHRQLDLPVFPAQPPVQSEPAVQKVYLSAYLPDDRLLVGAAGPWTTDLDDWSLHLEGMSQPKDDLHLIQWVAEGTGVSDHELQKFPTDGRVYLFTTLRPAPPPQGSLRLTAVNRVLVNVIMFGMLGLVCLAGIRCTLPAKIVLLVLIIVVLVAVGVFAPIFSIQVINVMLLIAIGLVGMIWLAATAVAQAQGFTALPASLQPRLRPLRQTGGAPPAAAAGESPFAEVEMVDEEAEDASGDDSDSNDGGDDHA